uniref:DUF659 domain-containing protein n=1 Tax=Musa acuminata subsp. malaccensis TaxID=214687 RepID=A0A804K7A4_MUSAM
MHLAGGYPDVAKCKNVPTEIRKLFQSKLKQAKEDTLKKKARVEEEYHRATQEPVYDQYEGCGDEVDPDLTTRIRASLEHQHTVDEAMRHRRPDSQLEHGNGSGIQRSTSMRQPTAPSQLGRTSSMRYGGLRGFMRGLGRRSAPDIVDIDPQAYPPQTAKQTRIDDAYTKEKKRDIGKAISKWFNFNRIPANTAQGPYYQSMISSIQKSGTGIQPPTPKEIYGVYLDEEVAELKDWIKSFKRQWDEYGMTLMCDSWIGPTRMSIINFLVYCNRKVVFHKSVNATEKIQDAKYIESLMDTMVEEIGPQYIVQIITDNGANFKKTGLQLMEKRKTLFWTPCAAHCIDLMLKDIGELNSVKNCVARAQSITKFIYNHHWQKRHGLKAMASSQEWSESRYSKLSDGKKTEKAILSSRFWETIAEIIKGVEPLYIVLRKVDMDKRPQMPYLKYMLISAREEVRKAFKDDFKADQYVRIIDRRTEVHMDQDIHNAAYYLNPAIRYRYALGTQNNFLTTLQNVIYRLLPNTTEAADALMEGRLFQETIEEEEEAQPQRVENPPRLQHGRSQTARGTTDTQRSHSSPQRAKAKGKAVASVASLEKIGSDDETPSQSHSLSRSVQRHDNNTDSSASTDDGGDAGQSLVSSTQLESSEWTEEQYFTHATQDSDHGTRQGTGQVYARKGKGKAVDKYEQIRQSIHDIDTKRGSSYYGESYMQQQYGDSWSSFSEQQHYTEQHQYMPQELPRTNIIHDDQSTISTTLMHQWHIVYQYTMS